METILLRFHLNQSKYNTKILKIPADSFLSSHNDLRAAVLLWSFISESAINNFTAV